MSTLDDALIPAPGRELHAAHRGAEQAKSRRCDCVCRKGSKKQGAQLYLPGIADIKTMVAESIEYLREHEPDEGYFVGFSGGKDSICTAEVCRMAGVKYRLFYSATGIDPPEVVRFIRKNYPDVVFLRPQMTFWEGILRKSPPLRMQRWCCDVLKKHPSKDIPLKHRIMGIRAEESARRASRPRTDFFSRKEIIYKPLFLWREDHIWEFIDANGLKYPSLYDDGFGRIGCVICPFIMGSYPAATRRREMSMSRWPKYWMMFERTCKRWFDSRVASRVCLQTI